MNKAEYEPNLGRVLEKNTANMSLMVRFYMNEMVIYSLQQAMRDNNSRVKHPLNCIIINLYL